MSLFVSEGQWAGRLVCPLIICDFSDPVNLCDSSYPRSCYFSPLETVGVLEIKPTPSLQAPSWILQSPQPPKSWTNIEASIYVCVCVCVRLILLKETITVVWDNTDFLSDGLSSVHLSYPWQTHCKGFVGLDTAWVSIMSQGPSLLPLFFSMSIHFGALRTSRIIGSQGTRTLESLGALAIVHVVINVFWVVTACQALSYENNSGRQILSCVPLFSGRSRFRYKQQCQRLCTQGSDLSSLTPRCVFYMADKSAASASL